VAVTSRQNFDQHRHEHEHEAWRGVALDVAGRGEVRSGFWCVEGRNNRRCERQETAILRPETRFRGFEHTPDSNPTNRYLYFSFSLTIHPHPSRDLSCNHWCRSSIMYPKSPMPWPPPTATLQAVRLPPLSPSSLPEAFARRRPGCWADSDTYPVTGLEASKAKGKETGDRGL
jgi:hypothetical protein